MVVMVICMAGVAVNKLDTDIHSSRSHHTTQRCSSSNCMFLRYSDRTERGRGGAICTVVKETYTGAKETCTGGRGAKRIPRTNRRHHHLQKKSTSFAAAKTLPLCLACCLHLLYRRRFHCCYPRRHLPLARARVERTAGRALASATARPVLVRLLEQVDDFVLIVKLPQPGRDRTDSWSTEAVPSHCVAAAEENKQKKNGVSL